MSNDDKKQKAAELAERTREWEDGNARGIGKGLAQAYAACGTSGLHCAREIWGIAQRRGGQTLDAFNLEVAQRGVKL